MINQSVSWHTAFLLCKDIYASGLAIIRSREDMEFIENMVQSTQKSVWIALKTNGSGLTWFTKDMININQQIPWYDRCIIARPIGSMVYWEFTSCKFSTTADPLCQQGTFYAAI